MNAQKIEANPVRTPQIVGPDGCETPATEMDTCADCGCSGLISDWPGRGALCAAADDGRLICDDCADTDTDTDTDTDDEVSVLQRCPSCGRGVRVDGAEGHDPTCPVTVAEHRAELAEDAYAGRCPFGYGDCYGGSICDGEPVEGSAGCAYTTAPR
ncbi:MAG: hypothetical protein ABIJ46_05155 [bacterium]